MQCPQTTENFLPQDLKIRWSKAAAFFEGDIRLNAVIDKTQRENFFDDYMRDLHRSIREQKKKLNQEKVDKWTKVLESDPSINYTTKWAYVKTKFANHPAFLDLSLQERLETFSNFIRRGEKWVSEQKRKQEEERAVESRKARENFRTLLVEQYESGNLTTTTSWQQFLAEIKDTDDYKKMIGNVTGSLACYIWAEFMENVYASF